MAAMTAPQILVFGRGHLAQRIRRLAVARGFACVNGDETLAISGQAGGYAFDDTTRALRALEPSRLAAACLVDEHDERNLQMLLAMMAIAPDVRVVASLFNENVAPHLQAAHPGIRVLNPAKIAAPAFIEALSAPLTRTLRYVPAKTTGEGLSPRSDRFVRNLVIAFIMMVVAAVAYFHYTLPLSWLDAAYFVVVTVSTVGYGDISLAKSSATDKVVGIALILASTAFIWMIFSLTVDSIIKRRVQLALGRRVYRHERHVIVCGLGRLGYFVVQGLLQRGHKVLVIERSADASAIAHLRSQGVDVYVGDARDPRVLHETRAARALAMFCLVSDDFVNLEIGLNARSLRPDLRLILRIFDEDMSLRIREELDIHLSMSMSAIADEAFLDSVRTES